MAKPKGSSKTGGRQVGSRNKRTVDGEAYARAIVEDDTVRAQILSMARDGSLSPELVKTFLAYAFGKPIEVIDNGDGDSPRSVTIHF
jgi:uncharacterized protein YbjT (DUF2867 family)